MNSNFSKFLKTGQSRPLFVYFRSFHNAKTNYSINFDLNDESIDGVLGTKPGLAEWKAQPNPLSYCSTPSNSSKCGSSNIISKLLNLTSYKTH